MHEFQDRAEARDHATRGPVRRLATALGLGLALVGFALTGAACSGSGGSSSQSAGSGEEEDYPNLARVPGEQPRPTPASLRRDLIDGLAADRDNARYSVEPLTAQTAATPPAAPPPAAKPQVEIIWETLRVLPEGEAEAEAEEEAGAQSDDGEQAAAGAAAAASGAAGASSAPVEEGFADLEEGFAEAEEDVEAVDGAGDEAGEEVEINWETERVEPTGKVAAAGQIDSEEQLILAPGPELVAVVYFEHNSDQVASQDRAALEQVVTLHKERGGLLRLVGHASSETGAEDAVDQRMVNLDLSLKRANAVATTLLDLGAEEDKLMIEAKADSEPADGELVAGGEEGNRRVEVFLEH